MIDIISKLRVMGLSSLLVCAMASATSAQQTQAAEGATPFASENAILDTSIPFAIGAQEAQQSLRGSFGWPTFQEGLVEGVYFRFDPDGYARFAPTPRLDTDVFEVICRPRTYSCMGRKGTLSVLLNSRGQLQLRIDDVIQGDRFFVSEGVSEIELPERVLQPLDTQLELLLSTGGDLIVRRGDKEKDRISLTGFHPVSAYLRWVTARQDYTILPRGWPVPNSNGQAGGVTAANNWQSPMPQPQNYPTGPSIVANGVQTNAQPSAQPTPQTAAANTPNTEAEVAEVKGELKILRELLLKRSTEGGATNPAPQAQAPAAQPVPAEVAADESVSQQIAALRKAAEQIQADLAKLSNPTPQPNQNAALTAVQLEPQPQPQPDPMQHAVQPPTEAMMPQKNPNETAERLHYLMTEIGLDAKTALMLVQMGESAPDTGAAMQPVMAAQTPVATPAAPASAGGALPGSRDEIVAQILAELEADVAGSAPVQAATSTVTPSATPAPMMTAAEYQLLSQYFRSVVIPRQ